MDGASQPIAQQQMDKPEEKRSNRLNIVAIDADSLPHGWERVIDDTHGIYYIDHNNQRTQYERPYEIELTKSLCGFGFTLIEAEKGLLTVRSIIHGGPAHLNGVIQPGDVLVSVVGVSISGLQHTDVARLFAKFAVGDSVKLTFARGSTRYNHPSYLPHDYLIAGSINYNSNLLPTSASLQDYSLGNAFAQPPTSIENNNFDLVSVTLKKGANGFGFTISDASSGQKVKIILDNERCLGLRQGDILMNLNGVDISNLAHKEVVEELKQCPVNQDATLVVKRKRRFRSKTPSDMHSADAIGFYHENILPQRNCKTPSLEVMMVHNRNSDNSEWAGGLDSNPRIQWTSLANFNGFNSIVPNNINASLPSITTGNTMSNVTRPTCPDYDANESNAGELYQNCSELQRLALAPNISTELYENGAHLLSQSIQSTHIPTVGQLDPIYMPLNRLPDRDGSVPFQYNYQDPLYSNTIMMGYRQAPMNDDLQVLPDASDQIATTVATTTTITSESLYGMQSPIMDSRSQYFPNDDNNNINNDIGAIPHQLLPVVMDNGEMIDPAINGAPRNKLDDLVSEEYEYHSVVLERGENGFGFRIMGGAEADRIISIGSIVIGGVAHKNGKLKAGDEIISINNQYVMGDTHEHVVGLMSACTTSVNLLVRRKKYSDAYDVVLSRSMEEGFGFVIISCGNCALIGKIIPGSPAHRCQRLHVRDRIIAVNGRDITASMTHPAIVNMIKESGATLKLRIIPSNCYSVELIRSVKGFGFSIRGGAEFNGMPLYILRVAIDGPAQDLLNVGDEIIEINNISTIGMTHQQAVTIISHSDPLVKLKLRRKYVTPTSLMSDTSGMQPQPNIASANLVAYPHVEQGQLEQGYVINGENSSILTSTGLRRRVKG